MSTTDRMYPLLHRNTRAGMTMGNLMPD